MRQGLTLLPRLEHSGTNMAHCNLDLADSSNSTISVSCVAETRGAHHHTQLNLCVGVCVWQRWMCGGRGRDECMGVCVCVVEIGSLYAVQAGLKLLDSSNPPTLASQNVRITGVSRCNRHFSKNLLSEKKKNYFLHLKKYSTHRKATVK